MPDRADRFLVTIADLRERDFSVRMRSLAYQMFFGETGYDFHDRTAIHFVSIDRRDGTIVGGARMIGPTPLPLEINWPDGTGIGDQQRPATVLQLGGLWLDPRYRRVSPAATAICRGLFARACTCARRLGVSMFILRTSEPRMTVWYRALGFQRVHEWDYQDDVWGHVFVMRMYLGTSSDTHQPLRCNGSYTALLNGNEVRR